MIPVCCADIEEDLWDLFFEIENETITHVDQIPYDYTSYEFTKPASTHRHTVGRVEIAGYDSMIKDNESFYIDPEYPITGVYREIDACVVIYEFDYDLDPPYIFDDLSYECGLFDLINGAVHIMFTTHLLYHEVVCTQSANGGTTCSNDYYREVEHFSEIDWNPPAISDEQNTSVLYYNDSLVPKQAITVPQANYSLGYKVNSKNSTTGLNESVCLYYDKMTVEYLNTSFPYGNVTECVVNDLYEENNMYSRVNNNIVINHGEVDEDMKMYLLYPYNQTEINYTIINGSAEHDTEQEVINSIFNILMMVWMVIFMINYFGKRL